MKEPRTNDASDYAVLSTENGHFYYGYESIWCPEHGYMDVNGHSKKGCERDADWCFEARIPGISSVIKIPFSKLRLDRQDRFECQTCLLQGIGWVLTKYKLDISDERTHATRHAIC